MQLPSLQELKRLGPDALTKKLDPSALERGLQYLRDGGFKSLEVDVLGSKGFQIRFILDETCATRIDMSSASQSLYSECDCYMAQSAKLCKHQAIAAWVTTVLAQPQCEPTRVAPEVLKAVRSFEDEFKRLKSTPQPTAHAETILHRDQDYLHHPKIGAEWAGLVLSFPGHPVSGTFLPENLTETLPQARSHQDYLLPDPAIPFYREADLPHPLWRSPVVFRGTTHNLFQSPAESAKRKSIHYLFTDGARIPVAEILYHKYSTLVPAELLPVASHLVEAPEVGRTRRYLERLKAGGTWDPKADDRLDAILLSVVESASKLLRHKKLRVYFSPQELFETSGRVLPLEKIEFHPPPSLKSGFHLRALPEQAERLGVGVGIELHSDWIWYSTLALLPAQGELFLHPFHHWLEQYAPEIRCEGHREFDRIFSRIQDEFHASLNEIHPRHAFQFLKAEDFTPHVRVHSSGTFSVELDFGFGSVDGLPEAVLQQLQVLSDGIRVFHPEGAEALLESKKQAKRAHDQTLLKHSHVAALVFQETLRHLIKGDRPFEAFFEILKNRIAILMNKIAQAPASPNQTLEIFCSKPAIDFVKRYVRSLETLFRDRTLPLVLADRSLLVSGAYAFYLKLLYAWVVRIQNDNRSKNPAKSRTEVVSNPSYKEPETLPDLQFISSGDEQAPRIRMVLTRKPTEPETLIRAFLPLQADGITLSLDGQSIEELEEKDFVSEFILEENADREGRIDWFELQPKFFFKGVEIAEDQARRLSETGMITFQGKIYRLNKDSIPSLESLTHFWDQLAGTPGAKRGAKKTDRIYRLPKHATLELLVLRATGVRIKGGPIWEEIVRFYDSLGKDRPPLDLPGHFNGELKPYQRNGVQWIHDLFRLGLGGILADDMGLGKTVQTLVFLELLREKNELGHSLIVVPTSLTYNWLSEATRFTPDLPVHIFQSREIAKARDFLEKNPQGLIISTYGLLAEHEAFFSNFRWSVHVYDEAQNLKTITAKRTTVSRKLPARFKLALTGTPLENHMGEFFSLIDLVVPGSLGSFDQFRKVYMQSYAPEPERVDYLKSKTRPLVLRRTKNSILKELPQKTESTVKIPFTDKQLEIYRDIALSWNSRVRQAITEGGESKSQLIMLTALLRLRQVCSSPGSIPNVQYGETPPKVRLLVDNLKAIIETGESALIFTQFLGTFELIEKELRGAGIPYFALHGKVSRKDREARIRQFQDHPSGSVMLMTLKTGGVGLNLTKASYVFHLEPWWNPAVENQATDRTHRIGQTKPVQVYRYIMSDSVEEKIEILKGRKSSQFNALFSDVETTQELPEAGNFALSQSDFEYLLGV